MEISVSLKDLSLSLSLSLPLSFPSTGASGGSDAVATVAALDTTILERRPKEEEEEEEQLCCFGDRTRATTADTLAAHPAARGAARLLLRLVFGATEVQGRAAAGANVARDPIQLRREGR